MPRVSNKAARREQIARGLVVVMAAQGYEGATIARIAAEAGLSPGLVHYHFADKQEILLEALSLVAGAAAARAEVRVAAAASPWDKVEAFVRSYLERGPDADPAGVRAWVATGAEALREPSVAGAYGAMLEGAVGRLTALVAEALPGPRRTEAPAIAAGLVAAIQGWFVLATAAPGAVPAGSAAGEVVASARARIRG